MMSDVHTRAQEALARVQVSGGELTYPAPDMHERRLLRDLEHSLRDVLALDSANRARAEAAEAKITAALKAMDAGRLYGPVRDALSANSA